MTTKNRGYATPHAPEMATKKERDERIAAVSRERGEEWARAFVEGAAAYRAALISERERGGGGALALNAADEELRRRFGAAFDRAVKSREVAS